MPLDRSVHIGPLKTCQMKKLSKDELMAGQQTYSPDLEKNILNMSKTSQ